MRDYIEAANLGKVGSCHLLRHTMATLMLENGADIRYIQQILGHDEISTTEIYTHVAIRKLQQVYANTHPAAHLEPAPQEPAPCPNQAEELFTALDQEADEDKEEG